MRAVVIDEFGGPEKLLIREVPVPQPTPDQVLIEVHAFGLNRSELHFRSGVGSTGSLPRIPGIEAVGVIVDAPGGQFEHGQQVAALMGGMGRIFDGGYAEYVAVPVSQVVPFTSSLPWETLGALPEMVQTANGSLQVGLQAVDGQTLLIRGGTSSVGMAIAVIAKQRGMTVFSTTRSAKKIPLLERIGVDYPLVDEGAIAAALRRILPHGVDGAVELVGTNVMRDTLRSVRTGGTVCFTGMLSDQWTIPEFYPMDWLPNGVRLTAYSGEASDLPPSVLQAFIAAIEAGVTEAPIGRVYRLDDIVHAHRDLEANAIGGKAVVTTR